MSLRMDSSQARAARGGMWWLAAAVAWFAAVAAGLAGMAAYANRPGQAAHAPARWPDDSRLTRDQSRPTIVMLAHPQCDCTRASLMELAKVMAQAPGEAHALVVFMMPSGVDDSWRETSLWRLASRIPGVTVVRDDGGAEAARFRVATSGQTLMYDAAGRLVFSGGTTAARGHEGDNTGVTSLLSLLDGMPAPASSTPVFGCALTGDGAPVQAN
jgi:hypothetical protein